MTRKAIIIGSPLSDKNVGHMPGAAIDVQSYCNYLTSPTGGSWIPDSEIITLINPTNNEIREEIEKSEVTYSMLIYTGHGSMDNSGNTLLDINENEQIPVSFLTTYSPRQIMIIDACRSYIPCEYINFTGYLPITFPSRLHPDQARAIFFDNVCNTVPGTAILYSTSRGESAFGNDEGGYFTQSLLGGIKNWSLNASYVQLKSVLNLTSAYYAPKAALQGTQIPELVRSSAKVDFPLAFRLAYNNWY